MSTLYNLEPNPTAKVLLRTTAGDLELELFAKQTPITSRNFLQLCLDDYYNNTIFHRLVPGFIVQGGDPTGTGHGGESSYDGNAFEDEYHTRLKFNRRGLVGMANEGQAKTNGSQFFFTLGPTSELQGKNTMFGRVAGDTIFNLMKIGEAELESEGSERPAYPTRILSTEVLVNPYEDMVKRVKAVRGDKEDEKKPKKPKRKAGKQLLSFGADEPEDGGAITVKKPKYNTKLVSAGPEDQSAPKDAPKSKAPARSEKPAPKPRVKLSESPSPPPKTAPAPPKVPEKPSTRPLSPSPEPEPITKVSSLLEKTNAQIAELKASMKRTVANTAEKEPKKQLALSAMIPETSIRGRKRRPGGASAADEQAALSFLSAFKAKLDSAPAETETTVKTPPPELKDEAKAAGGDEEALLCDLHFIADCQSCSNWQNNEEVDADDDAGWMSHSLSFAKDRLGKDLEWKRKNENELVVIDPREKETRLKEERKDKGKERRR